METNLIKTELTPAQILNPQLNRGYHLNAQDLETFCPIIHLLKLEIDQEPQPQEEYQLGMLEYITPHIEQIITKTNIPDYCQLISIDTMEHDYEGTHIWTFALTSDLMDYEPSLIDNITDSFKDIFTYDPEACPNHTPKISYMNGLFIILVPYTC